MQQVLALVKKKKKKYEQLIMKSDKNSNIITGHGVATDSVLPVYSNRQISTPFDLN